MLRVGNLQRSIDFYTHILGMQLLRMSENTEYKYTLAFVGYGSNPDHAEQEQPLRRRERRASIPQPHPNPEIITTRTNTLRGVRYETSHRGVIVLHTYVFAS